MIRDFYLAGYLPAAIIIVALVVAVLQPTASVYRPERERSFGGVFLVCAIGLLIGLRPISGLYVDMTTYATAFEQAKFEYKVVDLGDPLFNLFLMISAETMPVSVWFFLCALIYVVPKAWASKIWFGPRWPLAFAAMATSFSFYGFGVNGIRNGLATSLALLALAWPRLGGRLLFGAAAVLTHLSTVIPLGAYLLASRVRSIRLWLTVWIASIPVSLFAPNLLSGYFGSSSFDARSRYLEENANQGFRLDFLAYGALGVVAIAYWRFVRKIDDPEFERLAGTYLIANSFWIIVNQVSFSNRFAYLSWFLLEIVVLFPLLRQRSAQNSFVPVIGLMLINAAIFYAVTN